MRYVLLVEDENAGYVAVGPFASAASAESWEQRNQHLADKVRGIVPLERPDNPWLTRNGA